jgi:hypothetical protein
MQTITLTNRTASGKLIEATFVPEVGMNLISYKLGDIEIIDQSTLPLFEERSSGLGPIIGPHFHERRPEIIPKLTEEQERLFPHIARIKAQGRKDPFSHGIGRYAPWQAVSTPTTIQATLKGKDLWNGLPLSLLEGQDFTMRMDVVLTPSGLELNLSVVSDTDSIVGIHYYYRLPDGRGTVTSDVKEMYYNPHELMKIPSTWNYQQHQLTYEMKEAADFAFHPFHNPLVGTITLQTSEYQLVTTYRSASQENAWQLYHPAGASFVCIEPLSAQNPRKANLSVSSLHIKLEIQ